MITFVPIGFFAYALARLISLERGPYAIFERLRDLVGIVEFSEANAEQLNAYIAREGDVGFPDTFALTELGKLIMCPYCMATWCALIGSAMQYTDPLRFILNWLAGVGVAFMLLDIMERLEDDGVQ
jgi:hypothetical protein